MAPEARVDGRRRAVASIAGVRAALLRWYRRHRRDLPWRRTADPYAIWVSEVMLQQTQVATVLPYYRRFLDRFPDPAALARADEEQVLAEWSGLGYYRRARSLHTGAREVVRRHGGRVPADPAALLALPGVGRYTAGAIASIAFGLEQPILDGNVRRVLARLFAVKPAGGGIDRRLWEFAEQLVRGRHPGDLNQSLMELGALICTPRKPDCARCPVARSCRALAEGEQEKYPAAKPRPAVRRIEGAVAWVERRGHVLLERPQDSSPLRGTWDLPAIEGTASRLPGALARRHGLTLRAGTPTGTVSHGIMNTRLSLAVVPCRLLRGRVADNPALVWADPAALRDRAVSGATLKIARAAVNATDPRGRIRRA